MNKLSDLLSKRIPKSSSIQEDDEDISYTTENTPIMGTTSGGGTNITSSSYYYGRKSSSTSTSTSNNESYSKAICTYLKENYTFVIIAFLSLVILALAGENASTKGGNKVVANLNEDRKSAKMIQQRPCQIYIVDDDDSDIYVLPSFGNGDSDDDTTSSGSNNSNALPKSMNVIQTSLGNPNLHWDDIPCLVRRKNDDMFLQFKKLKNNGQWGWMFGSSSSSSSKNTKNQNDDQEEPIEYGMPSAEIRVNFDTIAHPDRQPILGFGGAFTEASALNYMSLNDEGREAVVSLLFGKNGLGYSLGRVHINSCDFSVASYNFDDVDGDFDLTNFDMKVEHDVMSGMIELMLQANGKLQDDWMEGGIKIMASPWSPPAWMKTPTDKDPFGALHAVNMTGSAEPNCLREGTGPDSRYAATWALYFSKFLAACKFYYFCFFFFS
jgi:hypothetical protein